MARRKRSSPMKRVLIIALIAGIAYGGPKGYFTYRADQKLAELQEQAPRFIDFSYDSVWADFKGERVDVRDITVEFLPLNDRVEIDRASVQVDGFLGLRQLAQADEEGQIPDSALVEIEGARVDVDGAIYRTMTQNGQLTAAGSGSAARLQAMGCEQPDNLGEAVVEHRGMREIVQDMEARLDHDEDDGRLTLAMDSHLREMHRAAMDVQIADINTASDLRPSPGRRAPGETKGPKLSYASLRVVDRGFNNARNEVCAERLGVAVDKFADRHVEAVGKLMERTGQRSPDFLERYRDYIVNGGDITFRVEPSEPMGVMRLMGMSGNLAMTRLNPNVEINGESINPVAARWLIDLFSTAPGEVPWQEGASESEDGDEASSDNGDAGDKTDTEPEQTEGQSEDGDASVKRVIPLSELQSYVDYHVRVVTDNGKIHQGRLTAVDRGRIKIRVSDGSGYVGYGLDTDKIQQVQLMR